jgi:uncharacterized membrane protein YsdA (DUF1294 family)
MALPAFALLCGIIAFRWGLPGRVPLVYAVASVVCFLAYAFDKSAARAGRWRTSENTLLLLGLVGGWPGGLIAQHLLRHKTAKPAFRAAFWATVVVNVLGLLAMTTPMLAGWWPRPFESGWTGRTEPENSSPNRPNWADRPNERSNGLRRKVNCRVAGYSGPKSIQVAGI